MMDCHRVGQKMEGEHQPTYVWLSNCDGLYVPMPCFAKDGFWYISHYLYLLTISDNMMPADTGCHHPTKDFVKPTCAMCRRLFPKACAPEVDSMFQYDLYYCALQCLLVDMFGVSTVQLQFLLEAAFSTSKGYAMR